MCAEFRRTAKGPTMLFSNVQVAKARMSPSGAEVTAPFVQPLTSRPPRERQRAIQTPLMTRAMAMDFRKVLLTQEASPSPKALAKAGQSGVRIKLAASGPSEKSRANTE